MFKTYTLNKIGVRIGVRSRILKREFGSGSDSDDTINKVLEYKRTCLSKSKCDSVFKDEYRVLPAMQYTGDTAFCYYVSVYAMPNLTDLLYRGDIQYQTTCCGKTIFNGSEYDKNHFMLNMAKNAWERLKANRSHPINPPTIEPVYVDIKSVSSYERWGKMAKQSALTLCPRIYLDMVVTTPDRNLRILF